MAPKHSARFHILTAIVLAGCGVLLARLHDFQIERRDEFRRLVPGSRTVSVREPGVRGEITDRHGVVLARNHRTYEVSFDLEEIYQAWIAQHSERPLRETVATEAGMPRPHDETDIVEIVNRLVIPRLAEFGLARNYSSLALRVHFLTHRGLVPFSYRTDLDYDDFAKVAEHNLDLPGVKVGLRPVRAYPFGSLACHVIGYVKQWEKGDIPERARREFDHYMGDDKGDMGVEVTMDEYLRGPEGIQHILKDEKGRVVTMVDYRKPGTGARVELTLDARKQFMVENLLRQTGRAAAVVIEADTGAVVAMASVPGYDPNHFIPSI